jgi:hypothetical protein
MKRAMTDFNEIYNFCEETGNTATYEALGRAGRLQGDDGYESIY